jgi:hypothetical protein
MIRRKEREKSVLLALLTFLVLFGSASSPDAQAGGDRDW